LQVTAEVLVADTTHVVLDTKELTITGVHSNGVALEFTQGVANATFGAELSIALPSANRGVGALTLIRIDYSTSPSASAIQFLPKEQTAGKEHPYLFTQCQAIHARSFFPCQDTPGTKCPYDARITAPAPLVALMSAIATSSTAAATDGWTVFSFTQRVPMPAYLVALAVGNLEERSIGPRSSVWSEPQMVDAGAYEFADTEQFILAAESCVGPYVWERYDVLLLPPSFPYGGMENPCLTFVTPTLLAKDRSLANVVAHEIAHSWMGNLVGCRTWEHFWLNEGFTVFLERRIIQAMATAKVGEKSGRQVAHMHAVIGYEALRRSVDQLGADHDFTKLIPCLDGVDPDDAFSSVPYEYVAVTLALLVCPFASLSLCARTTTVSRSTPSYCIVYNVTGRVSTCFLRCRRTLARKR
jgi:leukotriene-A4 hydrolase